MIELWLSSGTAGILLVPFAVLYLIAAGITWLTHLSLARPFFASCVGIAGPFFASVAVLFSLFAAFLANDVQHRETEAKAALVSEADGVRTILRLAEAVGPAASAVDAAAVAYGHWVLTKELPGMAQGPVMYENLEPLRDLGRALLAPGLIAAAPPAAHEAMMQALVEIRQARLARLLLAAGISAPVNWVAMLVLGFLTQVAVAVVQLDKLRPQALALFVFSTAFAATVALIGLNERPFAHGDIGDFALVGAIKSATE